MDLSRLPKGLVAACSRQYSMRQDPPPRSARTTRRHREQQRTVSTEREGGRERERGRRKRAASSDSDNTIIAGTGWEMRHHHHSNEKRRRPKRGAHRLGHESFQAVTITALVCFARRWIVRRRLGHVFHPASEHSVGALPPTERFRRVEWVALEVGPPVAIDIERPLKHEVGGIRIVA
jgi:hypothetical protein